MRNIRRLCVFTIINRGALWYETLTEDQVSDLKSWYLAWLEYPSTGVIPPTPVWLEGEVDYEIVD